MSDLPRLRPSSSDRWLNCPAAPFAPDGETSEAAEEGTRLHREAEIALSECLNGTYPIPGAEPEHDDDDVLFAVQQIWELVRPGSRVFLESPVTLAAGDDLISGTADVVLLQPDKKIILADYKFGVGIRVDADADQLSIYAAALLQHYREHGFNEVLIKIIQPRHHKGVWLDDYKHTRTRSSKIIARCINAIESIRRGDDPKGGDWCRWCSAKPTCPAYADTAFDAIDLMDGIESPAGYSDLDLLLPGASDEMTHEDYIDQMFESLGVSKQERKRERIDQETGEVIDEPECPKNYNQRVDIDLFDL